LNLAEVAILVCTDHPDTTAILAGCPNQQRCAYIDSESRQRPHHGARAVHAQRTECQHREYDCADGDTVERVRVHAPAAPPVRQGAARAPRVAGQRHDGPSGGAEDAVCANAVPPTARGAGARGRGHRGRGWGVWEAEAPPAAPVADRRGGTRLARAGVAS
ncbi:hypothetical protein B0H15DRAFT_1004930, partial [Mycena belliarum]